MTHSSGKLYPIRPKTIAGSTELQKSITIDQLHKMLEKAILAGHGDCLVCADDDRLESEPIYFSINQAYHSDPEHSSADRLHLVIDVELE